MQIQLLDSMLVPTVAKVGQYFDDVLGGSTRPTCQTMEKPFLVVRPVKNPYNHERVMQAVTIGQAGNLAVTYREQINGWADPPARYWVHTERSDLSVGSILSIEEPILMETYPQLFVRDEGGINFAELLLYRCGNLLDSRDIDPTLVMSNLQRIAAPLRAGLLGVFEVSLRQRLLPQNKTLEDYVTNPAQ